MPTVIQGFEVLTKPADTQLESFPVLISIPAAAPGNLRVITFPTEFSNFRSFSNMNIVSVTVQPGAAGPTIISGQMAAMPKSKPLVGL